MLLSQHMTMSSDTNRGTFALVTVDWYFTKSKLIARILAHMFKVLWPDIYETYRQAFDAGVWFMGDPGPWLGRAIVYKLQVHVHFDGQEAGPTASFPVGQWEGGHMEVPDLGSRFL